LVIPLSAADTEVATTETPSSRRLLVAFLRLGATAFGGPASVTRMRELVVVQKRWLSEEEFARNLALCQMLPGATAMQCAAGVGLRARGLPGAVATFVGFGLPGFLMMLAASLAYAHAIHFVGAQGIFVGLRLAVVAIVASATLDFGRTQIRTGADALVAALVAVLLCLREQPVLVVALAMLLGTLLARGRAPEPGHPVAIDSRRAARQMGLVLLAVLVFVMALCWLVPGLVHLALAMMKIDIAAFGGGFAALPLMYDEFVSSRGALSAVVFMDGIALGQITPGPIIITATFIGYQVGRLPGALVATVGVFIPSFSLVVATAPWFERLQRYPRVRAATRVAALAFVGLLVSATYQMGRAVPWSIPHAAVALLAFAALRKRINVVPVMLLAGLALGVLLP
jgi:chromate transporter